MAAAAVALLAGLRLLPAAADRDAAAGTAPGRARGNGWTRFVVVLGLLGAGWLLAETVAESWTAVFLGSLLGPAAIGWLAQGIGLTWALSSVLPVLAAVGWFATWTSRALPASHEDQTAMTARSPEAPY